MNQILLPCLNPPPLQAPSPAAPPAHKGFERVLPCQLFSPTWSSGDMVSHDSISPHNGSTTVSATSDHM